ncbi:MAG: DUF6178 family protein, partial [Nitrospinota bacterium]
QPDQRPELAREKLLEVHRATGRKKLQIILDLPDPAAFVRRLPLEDLFFLVKELERDEAAELVAMAAPHQVRGMIDLDCWKKDRVDSGRLKDWLSLLREGGGESLKEVLGTIDSSLLILQLRRSLRVYRREPEESPEELEEDFDFTLDNNYFIRFRRPQEESLLRALLEALFEQDHHRYLLIMEALLWSLDSILEEEAYRWRKSRLEDRGFPDYFDAIEVYHYLEPEGAEERLEQKEVLDPAGEPPEEGIMAPSYPVLARMPGNFFLESLGAGFTEEERERLQWELVYLANRGLVADRIDLSEPEAARGSLQRVQGYLNIGLEYLSGGRPERARELLRERYLQRLFQVGHSLLLKLGRRAARLEARGRLSPAGVPLSLLDSPYREVTLGLLKTRPQFFTGFGGAGGTEYRDFRELKEAQLVEETLEKVEFLEEFFFERLGVRPQALKELSLEGCYPDLLEDITLSTIFLTSWSWKVLEGSFDFLPLDAGRLEELHRALTELSRGRLTLRESLRSELFLWLEGIPAGDPKRLAHGQEFLSFCLNILEDEFIPLETSRGIDPRYIRGLLVRVY